MKPMNLKSRNGFTLVELMIAMAIALIVMGAVYQTYHYQQQSYVKQDLVSEMNANLKAGLFFLEREILMAGYDPTGEAGATITTAEPAMMVFQVDGNEDGEIGSGPRETINYTLRNDEDGDGIADWITEGKPAYNHPSHLVRQYNNAGPFQVVAANLDFLEFCYILDDGSAMTSVPTQDMRDRIRAVVITVVFRTAKPVKGQADIERSRNHAERIALYAQASSDDVFVQNFSGTRPDPWLPPVDRYIRKKGVIQIRCRNMGIDPWFDF